MQIFRYMETWGYKYLPVYYNNVYHSRGKEGAVCSESSHQMSPKLAQDVPKFRTLCSRSSHKVASIMLSINRLYYSIYNNKIFNIYKD